MIRICSLLLALCLFVLPADAKRQSAEQGSPEITFESLTHDFGTVREEDGWLEHTFKYTNSGTAPLAIATVSATCGCTKPEFSTKPIAPGKSGEVKIRFTPAGIKGEFTRTATVRTNVRGKDKKVVLTISGTVIPKKK